MRHVTPVPVVVLAVIALALAAPPPARAQDAAAPTWRWGGDVRPRYYDLQNLWDADYGDDADHWSALRLRTRLWASVDLEGGVRGMVRLANQNWGEGVADQPDAGGHRWEQDGKSGKVFVDAAWVEADSLGGLPLNARLGRQSVAYGTGFVAFDGQSHLGSTATFFDGARVRVAPGAAWTLDLMYLLDQENRRDESQPDDVSLSGLYVAHAGADAPAGGDLYALRRQDGALGRDVWLTGGRAWYDAGAGLDADVEFGLQRGDAADGVDQEAWGVKAEVGCAVGALRPWASFVGFSGDDPASDGVSERWDVFYGGWPQFGEHLAWMYTNVGGASAITRWDPAYAQGSSQAGEAVYANLLMTTLGLEVRLHPRLAAEASCAWLRADESAAASDDIGLHLQVSARYAYTRNLSFSLYGGYLEPGDAFGETADPQHLVYCDAELTF